MICVDDFMEHIVVFDTETTGLSPTRNGILALGAVDMATGDRFYEECRVDPDTELNSYAFGVNGFSEADARDPNKENVAELAKHFEAWCKAHNATVIAGYNVRFDIAFLKSALAKHGMAWDLPDKYVDVEEVYMHEIFNNPLFSDEVNRYMLREEGGKSLNAIKMDRALESLGVGKEPKPHNALRGALYCAELLSLMLYAKHVSAEFAGYPVDQKLNQVSIDIQKHIRGIADVEIKEYQMASLAEELSKGYERRA